MRDKKHLLREPPLAFINQINSKLSPYKGWIAAIESETGKYVLGKTLLEASREARKTFPDKRFYFIRIGCPYVHRQIGGLKKIENED